MTRAARTWAPPLVLIVALLGGWQLYVAVSGVDQLVLPSPTEVLSALVEDRALLLSNLGVTASEIVLGILVAAAAGFAFAVAIRVSGTARRALLPPLVASQAIPVPMVAPLLIVWLGFGLLPKLIVIALVSFLPVVVTTYAALEQVDVELLKLMRTFDASRWGTLRHVELPAALPGLFTGLKLAAIFSVLAAVFAEWSGAGAGLGYLFNVSQAQLETARAFAVVFVLSAFAVALFASLIVAERLLLPWAYSTTGEHAR
jgi:ABC-type nitrate/sulfonate/bicarbonate transport system permease component